MGGSGGRRQAHFHRRIRETRIIMGDDQDKLTRLWREKRGEVEAQDLSAELLVELGSITERTSGQTVEDVQRNRHPIHKWMGHASSARSARLSLGYSRIRPRGARAGTAPMV